MRVRSNRRSITGGVPSRPHGWRMAWIAYGVFCAALAAFLIHTALRTQPEDEVCGAGAENVPAFPGSPYAAPALSGRITTRSIRECSGIAAGRANPGMFWVHNDSGNSAHLFAIGADGTLVAIVEIPGATAEDWEDIAVGPGPQPDVPYLFIADTGDNLRRRSESIIYRLPEPALHDIPEDRMLRSEPPDRIRFTYPDAPHDCEALVVHPGSGDIYLFIKSPGLFSAFRLRRPGPNNVSLVAERAASMALPDVVTAADVDLTGRRLAIRTYYGLYEYNIAEGAPFEEIFKARPISLRPPRERQGEGVCYTLDGDLLTVGEDPTPPIFRLARIKPPPPPAADEAGN